MKYPEFVNREEELATLRERFSNRGAEFIVVYGKRRIGKSALLQKFMEDADGIYFFCRIESQKEMLKRFSSQIAEEMDMEYLKEAPFTTWDSLLDFFIGNRTDNFAIVFDEFPYAVSANPTLPSIFQDYWDTKLKKTNLKIIICGSSVAMMESLLGYKSPLYGRRTAQMNIDQMNFKNSCKFMENYSLEEKITVYSICGGTPAYLMEFGDAPLTRCIEDEIFKKDAFMYNEVPFLLREELKEPRIYFSILNAISIGKTTLSEIVNHTGYEKGVITKYLSVLSDLKLVSRQIPVTEGVKSRKGIYVINDNFFAFWFRYVFNNMEMIEKNLSSELVKSILKRNNEVCSRAFEMICVELLLANPPFDFTRIGSWWHGEREIDIVALNDSTKEILFCECKYTNRMLDTDVYHSFIEKTGFVKWGCPERKETYCLISKSGFTKKMKKLAATDNVLLFDLKNLENTFTE
ncbi:MAG: ATP-binding protein [Methanosarcinales archaeon]|nr:ATP-binding protein [Methanosarcinales archaeon]